MPTVNKFIVTFIVIFIIIVIIVSIVLALMYIAVQGPYHSVLAFFS